MKTELDSIAALYFDPGEVRKQYFNKLKKVIERQNIEFISKGKSEVTGYLNQVYADKKATACLSDDFYVDALGDNEEDFKQDIVNAAFVTAGFNRIDTGLGALTCQDLEDIYSEDFTPDETTFVRQLCEETVKFIHDNYALVSMTD